MNHYELKNNIKLLTYENAPFDIGINFSNFGYIYDPKNNVGFLHFMEHLICEIVQIILPNTMCEAYTSPNNMFFKITFIDNNNIEEKLTKTLTCFFNNDGINIDYKYVNFKLEKKIRKHIYNEKQYRFKFEKIIKDPLFFIISGYIYPGGNGDDIQFDINLAEKFLRNINTNNIVVINKDTKYTDLIKEFLTKIKNNNSPSIYIEYSFPKQTIKNSILLFGIPSNDYLYTILIPLKKRYLIAMLYYKFFYNFNFYYTIFNKTIGITFIFQKQIEFYNSIYEIVNDTNESVVKNVFEKIEFDRFIDDYLVMIPYMNIIPIISDINSMIIDKNAILSFKSIIKRNFNKYNTCLINIPYNKHINNTFDKNGNPFFYAETIFCEKFISFNEIQSMRYFKTFFNLSICNINNIACFLCSKSESFQNEKELVIRLINPKNLYFENDNIYVYNPFNKINIEFYFKFFIIFLITDCFLDINELILLCQTQILNIQYNTEFSAIKNIDITKKKIFITSPYNFLAVFFKSDDIENNKYFQFEFCKELKNKCITYVPILIKHFNFYYYFILTDFPIKAKNICEKFLNKHNILNVLFIISHKGKNNFEQLYRSKFISFK